MDPLRKPLAHPPAPCLCLHRRFAQAAQKLLWQWYAIRSGTIPNRLDVQPFVDAVGPAPSAGIMCHVGRLNVDLELGRICRGPKETCGAMVIAPYLGLVPQVFVSDGRLIAQEPGAKAFLSASLRFGAYGRMFGKGVSAEIDLLRWAPDRLPPEAR